MSPSFVGPVELLRTNIYNTIPTQSVNSSSLLIQHLVLTSSNTGLRSSIDQHDKMMTTAQSDGDGIFTSLWHFTRSHSPQLPSHISLRRMHRVAINKLGEVLDTTLPLFHHESEVMMPSKPIPIPPCKGDPRANDETAHEAQVYDAATWRMYQLISTRRRAFNLNHHTLLDPQQHHALLNPQQNDHATITSSQQQQQQQQRNDTSRDRVHSPTKPEPPSVHRRCSSQVDGVFVMD